MAGRIQSGPTTEEQARLRQEELRAEREHAAAAAQAEDTDRPRSSSGGLLQRLRRLLRRA